MNYLTVGKIVNTHGLKGELKIKSSTDFDRFKPGNKLAIKYKGEVIEVEVKSHRVHKELDLVVFKGLEDINLVEKYKGCSLEIDVTGLDELEEDEFYYYELIDLEVFNQEHTYIGKVIEVRELPQGELLVIKREGKNNALVPFNKEFIVEFDDEKIIINEWEGLL